MSLSSYSPAVINMPLCMSLMLQPHRHYIADRRSVLTAQQQLLFVFLFNHHSIYVCPPPVGFVREKVASDLMESMGESIIIDGVERSAITKMAWYPDGLAHKLGFSRKDVRKRIELAEFHKMLQNYTDSGSVTRQEEVRRY